VAAKRTAKEVCNIGVTKKKNRDHGGRDKEMGSSVGLTGERFLGGEGFQEEKVHEAK